MRQPPRDVKHATKRAQRASGRTHVTIIPDAILNRCKSSQERNKGVRAKQRGQASLLGDLPLMHQRGLTPFAL